jgi:hypothetical protein
VGPSTCPGRFVAKNVILLTIAYIIQNYDVDPLTFHIDMNLARYGVGLLKPKQKIAARIRQRVFTTGLFI